MAKKKKSEEVLEPLEEVSAEEAEALEEEAEVELQAEVVAEEAPLEEVSAEPSVEVVETVTSTDVVVEINGKKYKQWTDPAGSTFTEPL